MSFNDFVHNKCIELGKEVVRMTTAAGSGHPSSALSILHIVVTLMHDVMRHDPADPWHPGNDRLVLSEGHAVPAVYAAYADLGGVVGKDLASARPLRLADLATLREADSPLDGHPNPAEGFPFFDAATGSLGQGLSVGAGLALAARTRGIDRQIYVIIGDGESREGQIWEAMDFVTDHYLKNVVAIFNCNGQGQADYVSECQSAKALIAKAEAFDWNVMPVHGHDPESIRTILANPEERVRPLAVIAMTQKGWGCESLMDQSNHGKPVSADRLDAALGELDTVRTLLKVDSSETAPELSPPSPASSFERVSISMPPFEVAIERAGLASQLAKGKMATRRAYGAALLAIAEVDPRIVALDGDVCNSTFSQILAKKHPERFVECKIAEQNMISVAAGMAATGFIPFVSTFAKFVSRAYDQIEMVQITRANIKVVGSHAGVSLAADGPSQMSLQDVAYFRSAGRADNGCGRPACVTFQPCDAVSAYHCTALMASHEGLCYMRTHRPDVPLIYPPETRFEIGGSHVLAEGDVLTIVTCGYMVHVCRQAVESMAMAGLKCGLIDAYSFPLDAGPILSAARRTGNRLLCVEDNYIGGLGSAVAEAAAAAGDVRVESMTCRRIPKSAKTPAAIVAYVGLSPKDIEAAARGLIG
ncbi:MAG: transketolase [Phycisphaerae bacterium]